MKKIILILLTIFMVFTMTSCAEIEAVLGLIPQFSAEIPNLVSGKFVSFSPENLGTNIYKDLYSFNSKTGSFSYDAEFVQEGKAKGTYSVTYTTFAITWCSGKIILTYENGDKESFEFTLKSTANGGVELLELNGVKYYYWGEA